MAKDSGQGPPYGRRLLRRLTPRSLLIARPVPDSRYQSAEYGAGLLSKVFFAWCFSIVRAACLRRLEIGDFPLLNPQRTSKEFAARLESNLSRFSRAGKKYPFMRAIEATFRHDILLACSLQVASIILDFANIVTIYFLWQYLIRCRDAHDAAHTIPSFGEGIAYIATIVVVVCLNNVCYFHGRYRANIVGAEVKSACIGLVCRKACTIDPNATLSKDLGSPADKDADIVRAGDTSTVFTLCNVHADRLSDMCDDIITCLRSLLNYPLLAGFLAWFLGWLSAVVIGIVLIIQCIPCVAMTKAIKQRRVANRVTDDRIAQLESIFSGMRLIKYFGWEEFFLARILAVRKRETQSTIGLIFWTAIYTGSWTWSVTFAPVVAYSIYSLHSPSLVMAGIVFLTFDRNIGRFALALSSVLNAWPSSRRLEDMLTKQDRAVSMTVVAQPRPGHAIELQAAQFAWTLPSKLEASETDVELINDPEKQKTAGSDVDDASNLDSVFDLAPLDLTVGSGKLVAIVGPTQAGKSSLLSGLIKEMTLRAGSVMMDGLPSYCPQKAWIQSTTVKENVLFGQRFDSGIYEQVLDSCALRADIQTFPNGDLSELGERGMNLSGGQQHRIHLARTLYQCLVDDRKVVLLDDPLSAVDAIVSSAIFDKAISKDGVLAGRCRILATHQLQYLSKCDRIIYMRDGQILADGTFNELMTLPAFSDFVGEHTQFGEDEEALAAGQAPARDESSDPVIEAVQNFDDADAKVVMDEERAEYKVPKKFYLRAVGNGRQRLAFLLATFVLVLSQLGFCVSILQSAWWTSDRWHLSQVDNAMLYLSLTIAHACTWGPYAYLIQSFWSRRSADFSSSALEGVMRAPLSFYHANPIGRLINRFSSDISALDIVFPFNYWFLSLISVFGSTLLVIILIYLPIFAALVVPWVVFSVLVFTVYKATPLETKRLSANLQSIYLTLLHEALDGRTTIALAKYEDGFRDGIYDKMDEHNSVHFVSFATFEWASMCHQAIFGVLMFCSGLLLLHTRLDHSPSTLTIVFSMLTTLASLLATWLEQGTNCQKGVNAMERLEHFSNGLLSEGARTGEKPADWPAEGRVAFKQVSLQYKPTLPMVLKDVTFEAGGGEKLGIVGRTGAGKSTLLMALLRLYELAGGEIIVDGQDITKLGLYDVRHAIATIPQDPVMFIGSVRFNLDPTGEISDQRLLQALERVHLLGERAEGKDGSLTLDTHVNEGGSNFSSGQRQLLSLARALAKGSKIIVLDEPSSNVDGKMDLLVQQTIREAFADCTVMMIAHRLRSVLLYDRVVVMDKGTVVEIGPPRDLFVQPGGGYFRSLCEQASIGLKDFPSM